MRTADRGTDDSIGAWLRAGEVEVIECADAFDACQLAITQPNPPVDLALIGTDWLASEESAILSYFREVWPGVVIVVYGNPLATAAFETAPRTFVCRSEDSLRRMLADSSAKLRERLMVADRSEGSPALVPEDETPAPPPIYAEYPAASCASPTIVDENEQVNGKDDVAPETSNAAGRATAELRQPPAMPFEVLTPEELAALLEDEKE